MINKIKFTCKYSVRLEETRVVLFSSVFRKVHYLPLNTYNLLVEISKENFQKVIQTFEENDRALVKTELTNLIKKLEKDQIIEVLEE